MRGTTHRRKILKRSAALAATMFFMILGFQNFSPIPKDRPLQDLVPKFNSPKSMSDIRNLAPTRPDGALETSSIAVPHSGTDLNSIGQDWATAQAHLITGGADERMLNDLNHRLQRWIASDDSAAEGAPGAANTDSNASTSSNDSRQLLPSSLRFASLNKVEVGWSSNTKLSCALQGDSIQWNLSKPISESFDVNLRHESRQSSNSLQLNYSW